MRDLDETTITQAVIERNASTPDQRLKNIMHALVMHLHAFARETELTEQEWQQGIQFLTEVGQICSPQRQEFILLSDTLGLSTLVTAQNHKKPQGCTEATVFGPFHVENAPRFALGADIGHGLCGLPCFVQGRILNQQGQPIVGAMIDVWQADADGFYDVQKPDLALQQGDQRHQGRGVFEADAQGRYYFQTILPEAYPIPDDGPVGQMLKALKRHPWRPAHLHFMISAPGYTRLVTHVFQDQSKYLDEDAVFGVRASLIAHWVRHENGRDTQGRVHHTPFYHLDFDFILNQQQGAPSQA